MTRSVSILSPLLLLLDFTRWPMSLVLFGILPLLVIPATTPSSCIGLGFGHGLLRFRPACSKISLFFWNSGELANPLQKIDMEYKTLIGSGMVPISVSL